MSIRHCHFMSFLIRPSLEIEKKVGQNELVDTFLSADVCILALDSPDSPPDTSVQPPEVSSFGNGPRAQLGDYQGPNISPQFQ